MIGIVGFSISFTFSGESAFFPRVTSGVVLVGATLLLLRNRLPEPLYTVVNKDERLIGNEDTDEDELAASELEEDVGSGRTDSHIVLALMFVSFIIVARFIGLLFASPLFVLAYALWTEQPKHVLIIMVVIGALIPYLFMIYINLPVMDGILTEVFF